VICLTCGRENDQQAQICGFCGQKLTYGSAGATSTAPSVNMVRDQNEEPRYAGFWRRFLALFVDELILSAVALVFSTSYLLTIRSGPDMESVKVTALGSNIFSLLVHWLYFTLMESSPRQATLGKMAIGIIVTTGDGRRLSFLRANGRYFGKLLSALIFGIGFLMAGFTRKKQALHDMLADSLVICNVRILPGNEEKK